MTQPIDWLRNKWQLVKFQIVGVINTVIDYVVFNLLSWLGLGMFPAQCLGYGSGLLNSYVMNKSWTFEQTSKSTFQQVLRFMIINLISFGINTAVLYACVQGLAMEKWLGKGIATVVTLAANYIGYSRWVFPNQNSK